MAWGPGRRGALVGLALAAALAPPATTQIGRPGTIQTGNGRILHPAGRMTTVGAFPTGGALTPDGRFYWAIDAGHGTNYAHVIAIPSGRTVQRLKLVSGSAGVAFAPDGRHAYVAGVAPKNLIRV